MREICDEIQNPLFFRCCVVGNRQRGGALVEITAQGACVQTIRFVN